MGDSPKFDLKGFEGASDLAGAPNEVHLSELGTPIDFVNAIPVWTSSGGEVVGRENKRAAATVVVAAASPPTPAPHPRGATRASSLAPAPRIYAGLPLGRVLSGYEERRRGER